MSKEQILAILREAGDAFVSGERISSQLGISRAAVCKQVKALRLAGYQIESVTNRGYHLSGGPDCLSREAILSALGDHPWKDQIDFRDTITSTNTVLKQLAAEGAPDGSVIVAGEQTQGRGRLGRDFVSPKDSGIYLSVLLRPRCTPQELFPVTSLAAIAVSDAAESAAGVPVSIKWPNDLIANGRKLGGILTEISVEWETASVDYLIIGIGINCTQKEEDFPSELRSTATSLAMAGAKQVDRSRLAAAMIQNLSKLDISRMASEPHWLEIYRSRCVTLGKPVRVLQAGRERFGTAIDMDDSFGLIVRFADGSTETVSSGEVSVRGMYGYLE